MTYTKKTLEEFEGREEWMGFGYLGGFGWRSQETDEILIAAANEAGITEEQFFQFCNSKPGRKLDQIFEGKYVDGKFEPYWPIRECKTCGIWQSRDKMDIVGFQGRKAPPGSRRRGGSFESTKSKTVICSDCGLPTAFKKGPHADLHEKLVKFLPEICKELEDEN